MTTLVTFMGKPRDAEEYTHCRYRAHGFPTSGKRGFPVTGLVEIFRPTRVAILCTPEVQRQFDLCKEEIGRLGITPTPEVIAVPLETPKTVEGFRDVVRVLGEKVPLTDSTILDITLGFRSTSVAFLLAGTLLRALGKLRLERLTYASMEGTVEGGIAEVLDLTELLVLPELAALLRDIKAGHIDSFVEGVVASSAIKHRPLDAHMKKNLEELASALRSLDIEALTSPSGIGRIREIQAQVAKWGAHYPALSEAAAEADAVLGELIPKPGAREGGKRANLAEWFLARGQYERALLACFESIQPLCKRQILTIAEYPKPIPPAKHETFTQVTTAAYNKLQSTPAKEALSYLVKEAEPMRNSFSHGTMLGKSRDATRLAPAKIKRVVRQFRIFAEASDLIAGK